MFITQSASNLCTDHVALCTKEKRPDHKQFQYNGGDIDHRKLNCLINQVNSKNNTDRKSKPIQFSNLNKDKYNPEPEFIKRRTRFQKLLKKNPNIYTDLH